ncbi:hypothetical protein [Haloferax sp. KTX1]|uniref:hypothetical protein n=1 Tax=Haloferax sp. KTX1 TaxID=2600597 RepID=UPI001652051C|nr:hypothetical protein [Haloferax sp. KTX1]
MRRTTEVRGQSSSTAAAARSVSSRTGLRFGQQQRGRALAVLEVKAREASEQFTEAANSRVFDRAAGPVTIKYLPSNTHGEQL